MKAFTDYPIEQLGDVVGQYAPIREVEVVSYDKSLYCEVVTQGVTEYIKAGYIFTEPGRVGNVPCVLRKDLECLPVTKY